MIQGLVKSWRGYLFIMKKRWLWFWHNFLVLVLVLLTSRVILLFMTIAQQPARRIVIWLWGISASLHIYLMK